ncbi:MAG: ATP-binding protein [Endomicrobium sp.]|jgi:Holliday junction resolvase-like predicted endonuclease|nr:ATP-binding protein [Endomicrobium sp.]
MKNLPVGTQAFDKLRKAGAVYVDKTEHVYNLINNGSVYFLSRPRRFGKSLLVSTFKELFKANKELFKNLYIYDKWDWSKQYPVIHLDFAELAYDTPERLENSLSDFIIRTAIEYSIELISSEIETRFSELIEKLHNSTGQQVVVLIDEYDKPMMDSLNKEKEVHQAIKEILHNFYQVVKAGDAHIKFMFMTGVSRFIGLSVFSALNNLYDITMDAEFSSICGYTQEELESNFKGHIEATAESMKISKEELLSKIKYWYNGYSWNSKISVYNPFSTLAFFRNKEFIGYWYKTGTPIFLIEQIKKKNDIDKLTCKVSVSSQLLEGNSSDYGNIESVTLLFQTGYLTVKKKEIGKRGPIYTMDFPNFEVRDAFLTSLLGTYTQKNEEKVLELGDMIYEDIENKNGERLGRNLEELFSNIPYDLHTKRESYYHSLFLLASRMSGCEVEAEVHTDKGRIDAVLRHDNSITIVEIKYAKQVDQIKGKMEEGLNQIKDTKYYEKYTNANVSLLVVVFCENKDVSCKFENI